MVKMINAKKEFLDAIEGKELESCVIVYRGILDSILKPNFSQKDFDSLVKSLDFEYDNGFGTQYIEGFINFKDNAWCQRHEYDGAEYWEYMQKPDINDYIKKEV